MSVDRPRVVAGDALRVLAIVAVVAIHASVWGPAKPYATVQLIARFCIPVFVVVSGLALSISYRDRPLGMRFARRRLGRSLVPWLVWVPVYVVINIFIFGNVQITVSSIAEFAYTGGGYLWFLLLIPQLYAVFARWPKHAGWRLALVALGVQLAISLVRALDALPAGADYWVHRYGFVMFPFYAGYFGVGVALGRDLVAHGPAYRWLQQARRHLDRFIALGVLATSAATLLLVWVRYPRDAFGAAIPGTGAFVNPALAPLVFTVIAMTLALAPMLLQRSPTLARGVRSLSDLCLGVYIVHPFVVWLLGRYVLTAAIHSTGPLLSGLAYSALVVLGLAIAIVVTRLIVATPLAMTVGDQQRPLRSALQRDVAVLAGRRRNFLVLRHAQRADQR